MMDAAVVEENAMRLRESDRAILANRLIQSITPVDTSIDDAWRVEVDSRMKGYREGKIQVVEGRLAMDGLLGRFAK